MECSSLYIVIDVVTYIDICMTDLSPLVYNGEMCSENLLCESNIARVSFACTSPYLLSGI